MAKRFFTAFRLWLSHLICCSVAFTFGTWFGLERCLSVSREHNDHDIECVHQLKEQNHQEGNALSTLFAGIEVVSLKDFASAFDTGVPLSTREPFQDTVILYNSHEALPVDVSKTKNTTHYQKYTVSDATKNCNSLKIILHDPSQKPKECIAIMPQWESYHVQKFMRLPEIGQPLSPSYPFRYVSRTHDEKGGAFEFPMNYSVYYTKLQHYLGNLKVTTERLRPIAALAADGQNRIIAMLCNQGQSELLLNFKCACMARNLDTSNVLVFATDQATMKLANASGFHVFDVRDTFGHMPLSASERLTDETFALLSLAKFYCAHLVNELGYDVLLQDVDVMWYQPPFTFFEKYAKSFDLVAQDDGARHERYAVYSANSGFYFLRYNERTRDFLSILIRSGDLVQAWKVDQRAFSWILQEQASARGLRIKVYSRDNQVGQLIPSGFHYHRRHDFMKDVVTGVRQPVILHYSWTKNKDQKLAYMQQMGDWFVNAECSTPSLQCCNKEPVVICHYKDKPSKVPCRESPALAQGEPFW